MSWGSLKLEDGDGSASAGGTINGGCAGAIVGSGGSRLIFLLSAWAKDSLGETAGIEMADGPPGEGARAGRGSPGAHAGAEALRPAWGGVWVQPRGGAVSGAGSPKSMEGSCFDGWPAVARRLSSGDWASAGRGPKARWEAWSETAGPTHMSRATAKACDPSAGEVPAQESGAA